MGRLRLTELKALFWVALAGREARKRFRVILACRHAADRERRRALIATAVDEMIRVETARIRRELPPPRHRGLRAPASGPPATMPPLAAAFGGVSMEQFGEMLTGYAQASQRAGERLRCGGHEVLWVEGRGRVCLTCERAERA